MKAAKTRPRAVIAHGIWGRGGAEAAAMWIIAALTELFDVTVYTRGDFDLEALNSLAGTTVPKDLLTLRMAETGHHCRIGALAAADFLRSLRHIGGDYDLRVSASGILPWGRPALHFLSSIDCDPDLAWRFRHNVRVNLRSRISAFIQNIAAGPASGYGNGLYVANSHWLREQFLRAHSAPTEVIHPAVVPPPRGLPWDARENTVLVFGRISQEKRVDACIRIVERARRGGFSGKLIIAGPEGEHKYVEMIRALIFERRDWISCLPAQTGAERNALLGRVKYGLNSCLHEAFGISSAEMASAGIIVIVPKGTGQSEIVFDSFQQYASEEEAATKLTELGRDPELQLRQHEKAYAVRNSFSPAQFMFDVQRLARDTITLNSGATPA